MHDLLSRIPLPRLSFHYVVEKNSAEQITKEVLKALCKLSKKYGSHSTLGDDVFKEFLKELKEMVSASKETLMRKHNPTTKTEIIFELKLYGT